MWLSWIHSDVLRRFLHPLGFGELAAPEQIHQYMLLYRQLFTRQVRWFKQFDCDDFEKRQSWPRDESSEETRIIDQLIIVWSHYSFVNQNFLLAVMLCSILHVCCRYKYIILLYSFSCYMIVLAHTLPFTFFVVSYFTRFPLAIPTRVLSAPCSRADSCCHLSLILY